MEQPNDKQPAALSPKERAEACSEELAALLDKYGINLVAVPTYKPDGRGGWYTECVIQLSPRGA